MKHYQKAVGILGEDFFQRSHVLSRHMLNSLLEYIDGMIESEKSDQDIKEQANEFMAIDLKIMADQLIHSKQKQVAEGIEWLEKHGKWTDLNQIASHAMQAAINAAEADKLGRLGERMARSYKMNQKFLKAGIGEFRSVIDEMKKMMMDEGVMHWLKAMQEKPESEHVVSWKQSAKGLIIDLLDMDDKVDLYFDNSASKLSIYKDHHQHPNFGAVNHWTVVYGDPAPEYGEDAFNACQSEYFHLERKEQAVECLINRWLSGEAHKALKGSGSQSLEDIKTIGG